MKDTVQNAEVRRMTNMRDVTALGGDVQMETRRACSKNGPIKIYLCSYNADPKNQEEESWKMEK